MLGLLCETFARQPSEVTIEAYWIGLEDLSIESIEAAVRASIRSSRFMPSPAELRDLTGDATPKDRAQLAWELVRRSIGRLGGYVSPDFEDRAINATISGLGGWVQLTGTAKDELDSYVRHAFLAAYPVWVARASGESGDALPGILQQTEGGRYEVIHVPCRYLPAGERRIEIEAPKRAELPEKARTA